MYIAVTKIWKINSRLDHVINYANNELKTYNNVFKDLTDVIKYTSQDYKTEKQYYATAINCSVETVYKEMVITKKQYHKESGIVAYHAYQSFKPGEVTPEIAHEIGVKLAEEMWGERFEVLVTTHLDKEHLHNHFVINSISFIDGKRYYDKRSTYAELRNLSDSLCEEYGLSVIENENNKSKLKYINYQKKNFSENSYYTTTKNDIDRAIGMAYNYKDFECLMKKMNYELFYRNNKLSIRRYPYKKNIRIIRCFGEDYSIDRINERISTESAVRVPFLFEYKNNKYFRSYNYKKEKPKGIYALYLHYCYLLNIIPKNKVYNNIPYSIKNDVYFMEEINKETKLLVSENLETDEQFFLFKNNKEKELNDLILKRENLWVENRNSERMSSYYTELKQIKIKIDTLKEVIKLCENIEKRIPSIERNTNEFIKEVRKEKERYESIK